MNCKSPLKVVLGNGLNLFFSLKVKTDLLFYMNFFSMFGMNKYVYDMLFVVFYYSE